MRVDCHQHLWPTELLDALRARTRAPRLDGWTLHLLGEAAGPIDPAEHDATARAARERAEGTDRVLLSLSSPLGIEHLPAAEATPLIDAWHAGALALPDPFRVWAAACVSEPDPGALAKTLLHERVVGLQLPATAMADPEAIERLAPLLDELELAGKPLLVHPGPAPVPSCAELPTWWPALVPYVAQLHAAWLAWHVRARARHPHLRVAFVALAGLAPLHHERLAARGGQLGRLDPLVHYETSSYGARAIDAVVRVVGVDPIVLGSDRPYAQPFDATAAAGFGPAFQHALTVANPHHLLEGGTR